MHLSSQVWFYFTLGWFRLLWWRRRWGIWRGIRSCTQKSLRSRNRLWVSFTLRVCRQLLSIIFWCDDFKTKLNLFDDSFSICMSVWPSLNFFLNLFRRSKGFKDHVIDVLQLRWRLLRHSSLCSRGERDWKCKEVSKQKVSPTTFRLALCRWALEVPRKAQRRLQNQGWWL